MLSCSTRRGYSVSNDSFDSHRTCRWYRDPTLPVPRSEITRFPHAVLEVKLSLPEGQEAPTWVRDLIDSGYLTEVITAWESSCNRLLREEFASGCS